MPVIRSTVLQVLREEVRYSILIFGSDEAVVDELLHQQRRSVDGGTDKETSIHYYLKSVTAFILVRFVCQYF